MPTLVELTSKIVSSHAKKTVMTTQQLLEDMHHIHAALQLMEQGASAEQAEQSESVPEAPTLTIRQAFKQNEVICMVCGKSCKTLTRHLMTAHNLKPTQYRKQFNIPRTQKLSAKSVTEARRKMAEDRGMVDVLARARVTRMANLQAKKNLPAAAVRKKAPVPATRTKAPVPAKVDVKAQVKKSTAVKPKGSTKK